MRMQTNLLLYTLLIACAIGGFSLATFIHIKKRRQKPIICPIGHSCDPVVHSDYSRFLGIPIEVPGIIYYAMIAIAYSTILLIPSLQSGLLSSSLLVLSALAFVFSLYLTAIQAFVLREWCTWCLISAGLCAIIFFVGLKISDINLSQLFNIFVGV